jgi:hypothetical protein
VDLARHPQPERAAPIRVAADAIAAGVPARDVLLSRDHALYLDGSLVPVWQLANGATIVRQDGLASVTYVHVELDRHDIMLAENMPAESYLDTGNRALFANAAGVRALHPAFGEPPDATALRVWAQDAAAPLLLGGEAVAALRARLLRRALALGWTRSHHPQLTALADGKRIPARRNDAGWQIRVPATAASVRLQSQTFIPAERTQGSGDARRLGVAVSGLLLDGAALPANCLGAGWHAADTPGAAWRWTDGDARIALPPRSRPMQLDIRLAYAEHYWNAPVAAKSTPVPSRSRQSRDRQSP